MYVYTGDAKGDTFLAGDWNQEGEKMDASNDIIFLLSAYEGRFKSDTFLL